MGRIRAHSGTLGDLNNRLASIIHTIALDLPFRCSICPQWAPLLLAQFHLSTYLANPTTPTIFASQRSSQS